MSVVDDLLAKVDESQRAELEKIRGIIKNVVPEAEEVMTYGMPGFKYKKKYLISFAAFKNHMSLFPGAETLAELKSELGDHAASKGTIQFTLQNPLTNELIEKVAAHRKAAIDSSL